VPHFGILEAVSWSRLDWSPDGAQIAFECYYDPCYNSREGHSFNPEIYKANANGTGDPVRLTDDPATDTYPAFLPSEGKIAFSSNRDGDHDLYITNADETGEPQQLSGISARDILSDWQPVQQGSAAYMMTRPQGRHHKVLLSPTLSRARGGRPRKTSWRAQGAEGIGLLGRREVRRTCKPRLSRLTTLPSSPVATYRPGITWI
jgi:dipeptidyl aminopeptidase/acylaminoacyl peptidase